MNAFISAALPYVSTFDLVFWLNVLSTVIFCVGCYVWFPKWVAVPIVKAVDGEVKARRYLVKLGVFMFLLFTIIAAASLYYSAEGTITSLVVMSASQVLFNKRYQAGLQLRSMAAMDSYARSKYAS